MHPIANIRGTASRHLAGRRIVLGVTGSIAAVKTVELARELARHGAEVHAVMTEAATRILHPEALRFATGNPVITRLTGDVEHVALLGDVPDRADLFLVAPATANTVSKIALGIDDSPVTTCATVAVGSGVPIVVAPAMHEVMLDHPIVAEHAATLRDRLGITWVEPHRTEHKAKLADVDTITEAVLHRLASRPGPGDTPGPLAGKRALVVGGATAEPVDPVRILTNRSSGRSAILVARELRRLGADVRLWYGHATEPVPMDLEPYTVRFATHAELMERADLADEAHFDQVWMPAAINDYAPVATPGKIASGQEGLNIPLRPLEKVVERLRGAAPDATLVAFKAESDADRLLERARARLERYGAQFIVANTAASFGQEQTEVTLLGADGTQETFTGAKQQVLPQVVRRVAQGGAAPVQVAP